MTGKVDHGRSLCLIQWLMFALCANLMLQMTQKHQGPSNTFKPFEALEGRSRIEQPFIAILHVK